MSALNVDGCIEKLCQAEILPEPLVKVLCNKLKEQLVTESNVQHVKSPVTIVGDIHGFVFWFCFQRFTRFSENLLFHRLFLCWKKASLFLIKHKILQNHVTMNTCAHTDSSLISSNCFVSGESLLTPTIYFSEITLIVDTTVLRLSC